MSEKNPIICIIDDNLEDRALFRGYLLQDTDYHYSIYEEDTGEKGLALCRAVRPDCILLDYNLPDINGLAFLAALVDEAESVPFAVVMLAGLEEESSALRAVKNGAQDYLVKSEMTPGNLFRSIHSAIERTSIRRIVERQRLDLERKNQETQAFAYALAHDLRAPLRAISSFGQILAHDYVSFLDEDGQHYIQNIVTASLQMDRLIEDLLNYTRIEHRPIRSRAVALEYLLDQIVKDMQQRIAEAQASVTVVEDLPEVYGDPTLINQIFVNLLDNALTYRRPGVPAQIKVGCREQVDSVVVSVADNGIGIAEKHHQKIFNLFQRLHSEEDYPGTGIGLALVKKAVELLHGQVWLESSIGQGSTFFVRLPRPGVGDL